MNKHFDPTDRYCTNWLGLMIEAMGEAGKIADMISKAQKMRDNATKETNTAR